MTGCRSNTLRTASTQRGKNLPPLRANEAMYTEARNARRPGITPGADVSAKTIRDDPELWPTALRGATAARAEALEALHALLLRGAHFELNRRRASLGHLHYGELDDLATQAADDALLGILSKLDTFRGASRFTTWAYKFVLLEAGVRARRRAWHGREISLDVGPWMALHATGPSAQQTLEQTETLRAIAVAVQVALTPHQREVFAALALNDVPIDVLADRLNTTRGALYKTLHDARRKLRAALADAGLALDGPRAIAGGS